MFHKWWLTRYSGKAILILITYYILAPRQTAQLRLYNGLAAHWKNKGPILGRMRYFLTTTTSRPDPMQCVLGGLFPGGTAGIVWGRPSTELNNVWRYVSAPHKSLQCGAQSIMYRHNFTLYDFNSPWMKHTDLCTNLATPVEVEYHWYHHIFDTVLAGIHLYRFLVG
jgi:hypothetical protein